MGENNKGINFKKERLGEIRKNKEILGGYKMKIIEYNNCHSIIIEFQDKYKTRISTSYQQFEKGVVKNPYHPNVHGIGFLGDGKYKTGTVEKHTKEYELWKDMLRRCYDPYFLDKNPAYRNCIVCEEWHNFQNFARWYEENYYECNDEKTELDKDVLVKDNKIYSPNTCIFAPRTINQLIKRNEIKRGKYPIGVTEYYNKKYGYKKLYVNCNIFDKEKNKKRRVSLGTFPLNRPFQAFYAYKTFKENYIKQVADEYKDLIPKKLYDAMYKYEVEIND